MLKIGLDSPSRVSERALILAVLREYKSESGESLGC
jgi:hypothetical protein